MSDQIVTIEREDRIATVRFDRGDRANALSPRAIDELTAAARAFEDDFETSAVILMGPARTKQLAILAEPLPAERALAWGLVQDLADDGAALALARDYAARVADKPPVPVRMIEQAVTQAANPLGHALSYMDRDQYALAASSEDFAEGVQAFREKRPPEFTGR